MNEQRIRELSEQASTHAEETVHYYMGQFDGLTWEAKIFKVRDLKFAELIVRECAGLFPNVYVEIETDYGHTPVIASDYIKKHFGVEE